ncbi:MAG: bifunctional precorrin-2 dehydrogenase/sirohydrochlorin ferrochelatase [Deltaproteobacteria bacterium]|jgi:precorrin-2 dehydrogenase/sirohydrochlorin ferrochelatase|nr:bifunctional precorrin-2 dehydrogenase/sirohydrochlorin ferrochelatase [Deltaproteobacteria bacterium]
MPMPRYYPLFLDLSRVRCLVVGVGAVGRRKIAALLEAGVRELVALDPESAEKALLPEHPALVFEARGFMPDDLAGCSLVFAASGSREVNAAVAAACEKQGIFCNSADAPLEGACIVPATVRVGEMMLALSTGGASPAYARHLREELEVWLHDKAPLAALLGRIRPRLLALGKDTMHNTRLFRTLVQSGLGAALAAGDPARCTELLAVELPEELHPWMAEFLDGLV